MGYALQEILDALDEHAMAFSKIFQKCIDGSYKQGPMIVSGLQVC